MTNPRFKFSATGNNGEDMTDVLASFADFIGLESISANRYSMLLVLELFASHQSGLLNPAKVIHEIRALEGIGRASQLKQPTQFKRTPLKGLWHKHYQEDGLASFAFNIKRGLDKFGIPLLEQRTREAQEAGEVRYMSLEDANLFAADIVSGNWKRLTNSQALTGEWLVYAQHECKNYYLCIGKHNSGDNTLRTHIDAICCLEFPFLTEILQ